MNVGRIVNRIVKLNVWADGRCTDLFIRHMQKLRVEMGESPFLLVPIRPTGRSLCARLTLSFWDVFIKRVRNKMPADIPPDAKIKMANDLRKAIRELRDRGLMVAAKWYVFAP